MVSAVSDASTPTSTKAAWDPHRRSARGLTRNLTSPDETVRFEKWSADTVTVGDIVVGRLVLEPGYRWSRDVRPTAGTPSCQFHHAGVALSGAARFRLDDGTEFDVRAGDVFDIPPGHDNWVLGDEPAISIVWGGWRGWGKPQFGSRVLVTILMTDIVASTEHAAAMGDAAWAHLLERHNVVVRTALERYGGTEIDTAGDGFLTRFDGAARALHAALDIRRSVRQLGVDVRVGIHTGEVEVVPGRIRGLALHEAARIMALASAGEVLASQTTRDIAFDAGVHFHDRGIHALKGVPAPRQVFAVTAPHG
jgi:class 3 adenylate cyclase